MKKINLIDMMALFGGDSDYDECLADLQIEANYHENTGDKDTDNDYWDDWGRRYEECVGWN